MQDVLIIGAGPAGLAAGITLASEGRRVTLLERGMYAGGQVGTSFLVENFPPFSRGFAGAHFTQEACAQCARFGVRIEYDQEARAIIPWNGGYNVRTNRAVYTGRSVLLALGLDNRNLNVPGEDLPHVHHGMRLDAFTCIEREVHAAHVALVGGGNSVGQAAVYYLSQGASVTIIARRPLRETMSDYLLKGLQDPRRVTIDLGEVQSIRPFKTGMKIRVASLNGRFSLGPVDCVHIFIGQRPGTNWLGGIIDLDEHGYILTDNQHRTSLPGVFAVGDVVSDAVRRVACAVGYGNEVVPVIHRYLEKEAA